MCLTTTPLLIAGLLWTHCHQASLITSATTLDTHTPTAFVTVYFSSYTEVYRTWALTLSIGVHSMRFFSAFALSGSITCDPTVNSVRFQGNFLLSGSSDKSAIVWDVARGDVQQQFRFHEAPTLVSWTAVEFVFAR